MKLNKASLLSLLMLGAAVLLVVDPAFAQENGGIALNDYKIRCAAAQLITLTEGNLGALIMIVAGIGTIIASAFGAFRAATSLLAVALGSFVLRSLVVIFFNADLNYHAECNQGSRVVGSAEAGATPGNGNSLNNAIGVGADILGTVMGGGSITQEQYAAGAGVLSQLPMVSGPDGNVSLPSAGGGAAGEDR